MANIFITGIGTEVGKTITSAIVTEALEADYFKPIQAGDLDFSDTHKVKQFISNSNSTFHKNSYALKTPMSPHAAAELENIEIDLEQIKIPTTQNHLVIEGAGGLLVPLNDTQTIFDIISLEHKVIVVSRHYLGSINHSLLTLNLLKNKGYDVAIIFSGKETPSTESIITKMTDLPVIGRIDEEDTFDQKVIKKYADEFRDNLLKFITS